MDGLKLTSSFGPAFTVLGEADDAEPNVGMSKSSSRMSIAWSTASPASATRLSRASEAFWSVAHSAAILKI